MTDPPSPTVSSESRAAVGRLIARERVRAMESLAAAIAHELRSAVLGVTSAAQLLRYSLPPDPVAEKSLGRILQESERLSSLHEALSEYAVEVPPRFISLDPDEVWSKVLVSMRGALEARSVKVVHLLPAAPARCLIDDDQMNRAFERILHHAMTRSQTRCEVAVTSSVDADGGWQTVISTAAYHGADHRSGSGDFERPAFQIALANRTIVAHGGEVIDDSAEHAPLRITIRLPGS